MQRFYFVPGAALLIPALLLTSACGGSKPETAAQANKEAAKEEAKKADLAFVRYISTMAAHSGSDLYFGDTKLFGTGDATKVTDYKTVPAERHEFALKEAGQPAGDAIEKDSEGLGNGKHYTVVAFEDENGKPKLRVVKDDESAPDAGKAKVRIIHAAPGMEAVNVYGPDKKDKIASETRFTTVSTWQQVDPVSGALEVRTSDPKSGAAKVPVAMEAGKLYTLVVEGGVKAKEKLKVTPIVDIPAKV